MDSCWPAARPRTKTDSSAGPLAVGAMTIPTGRTANRNSKAVRFTMVPPHTGWSPAKLPSGQQGARQVAASLPVGILPSLPGSRARIMQRSITLNVNGAARTAEVEPRALLAYVLRDQLDLTGTHIGCDTSQCGACTVHIDGHAVKSCTVLAMQAEGHAITTTEGLSGNGGGGGGGGLHPLQQAFWEKHGPQCGVCAPGRVMTAAGLVAAKPKPTEAEIRHALEGNLCRCTGYQNIVAAIQAAAGAR